MVTTMERLFIYKLFQHYYSGDFLPFTPKEWKELAALLKEISAFSSNKHINQAINILEEVTEEITQTFPYDYNRLFIGPNQLLASPFESSYVNVEGTVMQQETLKVRNFYNSEGLQVADEDIFPDDHLQYELEFICYLLNNTDDKADVLQSFLDNHFLRWISMHCDRIEVSSQNRLTLAMGYLLNAWTEMEKLRVKGGERSC